MEGLAGAPVISTARMRAERVCRTRPATSARELFGEAKARMGTSFKVAGPKARDFAVNVLRAQNGDAGVRLSNERSSWNCLRHLRSGDGNLSSSQAARALPLHSGTLDDVSEPASDVTRAGRPVVAGGASPELINGFLSQQASINGQSEPIGSAGDPHAAPSIAWDWGVEDGRSSSGAPRFAEEADSGAQGRRFKLRNGREILQERAFLVGVEISNSRTPHPQRQLAQATPGHTQRPGSSTEGAGTRSAQDAPSEFPVEESLQELGRLCDTAGLNVVGSTYQRLETPNSRTYIGSGKVQEVRAAVAALDVETVVFDDELSPGQLRNLEKELGEGVRVCDRTALILDIFSQRAATKEATLQVELAQMEYQLPRLTRMWTHLERQAGGLVKGMGEKQIEVDKRILRDKMSALKKSLKAVQGHRQQYRKQRAEVPVPVISLVGYTNAGKSTLMNRLSGAGVLAEDQLFATLDPTTRRVQLPNGKECLLTDTVGFIQKLPTQLVAAFRATLEEIADASVLLHVVDASDPMAGRQMAAVEQVLDELGAADIPCVRVLNKVDCLSQQQLSALREEVVGVRASHPAEAEAQSPLRHRDGLPPLVTKDVVTGGQVNGRGGVPGRGGPAAPGAEQAQGLYDWVEVSALTGDGIQVLLHSLETVVNPCPQASLVTVDAVIPFAEGQLLNLVFRQGAVTCQDHSPTGTRIRAHVPLRLAQILMPYRKQLLFESLNQ